MKYGVLGTGDVGKAIGGKLIALGHEVCMGSRSATNEAATGWATEKGERASHGTFADAAAFGEIVFLCVKGEHALAVIEAAGVALDGKPVADLTNPLDFSQGFPPRLSVCNDDSLGEQIQKAAPKANIVKTFNTLANAIMVDPGKLAEPSDVFVAGNDADAKRRISDTLQELGHQQPIDMGGIEASRGLEAWLLLWTRLYGVLGTGEFNIKIVRASS
jgi:predicted dinucleotide-binding enzyme